MNANNNILNAKESVENGINSLAFIHRLIETASNVANSHKSEGHTETLKNVLENIKEQLQHTDIHLEQAFVGVRSERFQS